MRTYGTGETYRTLLHCRVSITQEIKNTVKELPVAKVLTFNTNHLIKTSKIQVLHVYL